jgi:DNA mismatch repair protein MutL
MNIIKILPENIASKIAAGEVVQRPESVVKELLENAIDAGADSVEVVIRRAGKSLIQVCDNGTGMNEEDALLCFQKHATSKISKFDDLESISTLGFRGEALCSIAAVSQLEIKTETIDDEIGTLVRIENGTDIIKEKGSYSIGTCVSVKNLFFNTPARRNFMKSDATELKHIIDTFNKLALSHSDLSFKFYNDDQLIYNYTAGDLENRIKQVFADNMMEALVPVEERTDFMNVYGYIGKPAILKKSRGDQYIFLNSRYVMSRQINHAVFTAYDNFLEKGDYPFFIIFIDLDPRKTDVNVHPSKLEVRFDDERNVYNFILAVVKKSLGTYEPVTDISFTGNGGHIDKSGSDISFDGRKENNSSIRNFSEKTSFAETSFSDQEIDRIFGTLPDNMINPGSGETAHPFQSDQAEIYHETPNKHKDTISEEPAFIIQLHNKYILSQIKTGLMVIDQHLAHERILYEKALKRMDADLPFSQQLLFSKRLKPDAETFNVIKEISPYLIKLGFAIKLSGKSIVVIEGVPEDVKQGTEEKILMDLISQFVINRRDRKLDIRENIAESYSSKTAIKAGDRLSGKEMRLLIDQLFAASMPYVCPHGRPVVVKIPLDEFDRRFGRS